MLIYSMSLSADGFIADREGGFLWSRPDDEVFRFHLDRVRELGACLLGRKLYETTVVFSRTLDGVEGNARLATGSLAEEAAAVLAATDRDVEVGGATPYLPPVTEAVPLELIETRSFGSRVVYERYGRAR